MNRSFTISCLKSQKGFTLVEMLVVIAVIFILAGVIYANLAEARKKARDTDRFSDISQLELAIEAFASANGRYPSSADGLCTHKASFAPGGCLQILVEGGFFDVLPADPLDDGTGVPRYYYDNWCSDPGPGYANNNAGYRHGKEYRMWTFGEKDHDAAPLWWNDQTIGVTTCADPS